jgi:hypothetical protein
MSTTTATNTTGEECLQDCWVHKAKLVVTKKGDMTYADVLAPMDVLLFALRIIVGLNVLTVIIMNGRMLVTHMITITYQAWEGQVSLVIGVNVVVG